MNTFESCRIPITIDIIKKSSVQLQSTVAELVEVPGGNGLYAYKSKHTTFGARGKVNSESTTQGFTKVPKLVKGFPVQPKIKWETGGRLVYLRETVLETINQEGFWGPETHSEEGKDFVHSVEEDSAGPFDNIVSEKKDYKLVSLITNDHTVKDADGKYLPVAVHCDYISAGFRNGKYDLQKAVEILQKRDDIKFLKQSRYGTREDEVIESVPSYNSDKGCTSCITFVWQANVADYRKVMDAAGARGTLDFHKAMFDTDILGLQKGGASKYKDFYEEDKHERDDEYYDEYEDD